MFDYLSLLGYWKQTGGCGMTSLGIFQKKIPTATWPKQLLVEERGRTPSSAAGGGAWAGRRGRSLGGGVPERLPRRRGRALDLPHGFPVP